MRELFRHCILILVGWVCIVWSIDFPTNGHNAGNKFNVKTCPGELLYLLLVDFSEIVKVFSVICCFFVLFFGYCWKNSEGQKRYFFRNNFLLTLIVNLVVTLADQKKYSSKFELQRTNKTCVLISPCWEFRSTYETTNCKFPRAAIGL